VVGGGQGYRVVGADDGGVRNGTRAGGPGCSHRLVLTTALGLFMVGGTQGLVVYLPLGQLVVIAASQAVAEVAARSWCVMGSGQGLEVAVPQSRCVEGSGSCRVSALVLLCRVYQRGHPHLWVMAAMRR